MNRHFPSLFELLNQQYKGKSLQRRSGATANLEGASPEGVGVTTPETSVETFDQATPAPYPQNSSDQQWIQAESQWWAGISVLTELLQEITLSDDSSEQQNWPHRAVILSGPLPILQGENLRPWISSWLFMPRQLADMLAVARPMLPFQGGSGDCQEELLQTIPLDSDHSLGQERFCLVLTRQFSLSLVLSRTSDRNSKFRFSFDPNINQQVWLQLRSQIAHNRPPMLARYDALAEQLPWVDPHYRLVSRFSDQLLQQLQIQASMEAESIPTGHPHLSLDRRKEIVSTLRRNTPPAAESSPESPCRDAQFLQAMAHEIRTPLTTIRTFTRSLLKRQDLSADVVRRLQLIDRECTQQIDRFNLIFQAVELETGSSQRRSPLSPISLGQIFQQAIPAWQQQVQRRGLTLEVDLPSKMPTVTSDPAMLQQVLTGLIERFTQSLPAHSHINLTVVPAGHQLKLQFQSHATRDSPATSQGLSPLQSLGQLLMFQPETGGVSLNLNATKNLFNALGGKLIVRQKPQSGEVLTVFLPLESRTI